MTDTVELIITTPEPFWTNIQHPEYFARFAEPAMENIMVEFKSEMEVYAPESEANAPGRTDKDGRPMGYYERGRGWWYPIMQKATIAMAGRLAGAGLGRSRAKFGKSLGVIKGGRRFGVAGYKLIPNSQQMGERWVAAVQSDAETVIGTLFNGASYSGLVQGPSQTELMASRQWNDVDDVWNSDPMQGALDKEISGALDQMLAG
jgi:hypothetical protein